MFLSHSNVCYSIVFLTQDSVGEGNVESIAKRETSQSLEG